MVHGRPLLPLRSDEVAAADPNRHETDHDDDTEESEVTIDWAGLAGRIEALPALDLNGGDLRLSELVELKTFARRSTAAAKNPERWRIIIVDTVGVDVSVGVSVGVALGGSVGSSHSTSGVAASSSFTASSGLPSSTFL